MKKKIIKEKMEMQEKEIKKLECDDKDCPIHGKLKIRGRTFYGKIIKKFPRRIVIEFERIKYISKYERFSKAKTKLHARVSKCMEDKVKIGDYVKIKECRPLSKIIHFALIEKIKSAEDIK